MDTSLRPRRHSSKLQLETQLAPLKLILMQVGWSNTDILGTSLYHDSQNPDNGFFADTLLLSRAYPGRLPTWCTLRVRHRCQRTLHGGVHPRWPSSEGTHLLRIHHCWDRNRCWSRGERAVCSRLGAPRGNHLILISTLNANLYGCLQQWCFNPPLTIGRSCAATSTITR